jgi:hypothetical protein
MSSTTSGEALRVLRGVISLGLVGAVLLPGSAAGQVHPNHFDVGKLTCKELLSYTGDNRARLLIYFNGYVDGRAGTQLWEDKVVGARVDRALDYCRATPSLPVLEAFTKAWKP